MNDQSITTLSCSTLWAHPEHEWIGPTTRNRYRCRGNKEIPMGKISTTFGAENEKEGMTAAELKKALEGVPDGYAPKVRVNFHGRIKSVTIGSDESDGQSSSH